jgi:DNA-binding IclR family transcriptional regulator
MEKAALAETTGIDPASLKYHIDFLISGEFLKTDGDTYRLTEKGLELLSDCESRAFLC